MQQARSFHLLAATQSHLASEQSRFVKCPAAIQWLMSCIDPLMPYIDLLVDVQIIIHGHPAVICWLISLIHALICQSMPMIPRIDLSVDALH